MRRLFASLFSGFLFTASALLFAGFLFTTSAFAQSNSNGGTTGAGQGGAVPVTTNVIYNAVSSVMTRYSNTTAYAMNLTSNPPVLGETVCATLSPTICVAQTVTVTTANGGNGTVLKTRLVVGNLTGALTNSTNATFAGYLFTASPTLTAQYDATAYDGPRAADVPNYIGYVTCGQGYWTSDASNPSLLYDCTLSGTAVGSALSFTAGGSQKTIYIVPVVTGNWTPPSAATFISYLSGTL